MMLTKAKILQELNSAKIAHERWVKRAEHLVDGLPVDQSFIPLDPTECGFGRWLYSDMGQRLRLLKEYRSLIEQIEFYHDKLHDIYRKIYKIYFVIPNERSLLHKILTFNSKKITSSEQQKAQEYFMELQKSSIELKQLLIQMEHVTKEITSLEQLNGIDTI